MKGEVVKLKNSTYTRKLIYRHDDVKQGKSGTGARRGVCVCADGASECDSKDRQVRTLTDF